MKWNDVKKLLNKKFKNLNNVEIYIFEPEGAPLAKDMVKTSKKPKMTPGRAALIELIKRYLDGLIDPFITLLEVHKLMYFLQESGVNLKLIFKKGYFGSYAENLRHVLNKIEGHFIIGYADGHDDPKKELKLINNSEKIASNFLLNHEHIKKKFEKVSNLVDGFESSFGLELLSTVHWIVKKEKIENIDKIIKHTYDWHNHKRQFSKRQIKIAYNVLKEKKWI